MISQIFNPVEGALSNLGHQNNATISIVINDEKYDPAQLQALIQKYIHGLCMLTLRQNRTACPIYDMLVETSIHTHVNKHKVSQMQYPELIEKQNFRTCLFVFVEGPALRVLDNIF